MRKLGISIYPEKSNIDEIKKYIEKMSKIGASRIFSCLLSVNKDIEYIKNDFLEIHNYAKSLGYEIILDISPKTFSNLNIGYNDLKFFSDLNADGIRLDIGFTGLEESIMTYNPYGLKIEINASNLTHTIDTIMDYKPNTYKLYGCHNFYPHKYTGLSLEYFEKCSLNFKKHGLRLACFIGSNNTQAYGPWQISDGLCTLEMHRSIPIDTQLKHIVSLGYIDDILISNYPPSEKEIQDLAKVNLDILNLNVELVDNIPDIEKSIILDELHFNRGDVNEYMIRSTQSRVKYKNHNFKVFNAPDLIKKGDIIIESSEYGHYAGELQIALKDMVNSKRSNVVGKIIDKEKFILEYIKPWQKFLLSIEK